MKNNPAETKPEENEGFPIQLKILAVIMVLAVATLVLKGMGVF